MSFPFSRLVFGTYRLRGEELKRAVTLAWDEGFRSFDTARLYGNEAELATVLSGLRGADDTEVVYITTKYLHKKDKSMELIAADMMQSVNVLRFGPNVCVRLLLHHPAPLYVWQTMEMLHRNVAKTGVYAIGVSNHSSEALQSILHISVVAPCVNQLEVHPHVPSNELEALLVYCAAHLVPVEAHSILVRGMGITGKQSGTVRDLVAFALSRVGVTKACVMSTNRQHLMEIVAAARDDVSREQRMYPLRPAPRMATAIPFYSEELIDCVTKEIVSTTEPTGQEIVALLPTVKSKLSDLGRWVAYRLYFDECGDDMAACCAKYHAVTKRFRRVAASASASVVSHNGSCCVVNKKKPRAPADAPISGAVLHPEPMPVVVAPIAHLNPIFEALRSEEAVVCDVKEYYLGALRPDAVDLCKQVVGPHIAELCDALKGTTRVKHFLLGNNVAFATDQSLASHIADLMRANQPPIETWYLAGNCIGPEALELMCAGLETNTVANALWLKRNPLMPRGMPALCRMLNVNRTLTLLDLDNCGILDEGVELLCNGLKGSSALKHIYLDANGITASGAATLGQFLCNNTNLKSFYASINRFGDDGVKQMLDTIHHPAVARSPLNLTRFSVGSNRLTNVSAQRIVAFVLQCLPRLKVLDVGCYKSTFDMGEQPNAFTDPEPFVRLLSTHMKLRHLDVTMNAMRDRDAELIVEAARARDHLVCGVNVYCSTMNGVGGDTGDTGTAATSPKLSYEAYPSKTYQKTLKHPKCVVHIDSIYRNKM